MKETILLLELKCSVLSVLKDLRKYREPRSDIDVS